MNKRQHTRTHVHAHTRTYWTHTHMRTHTRTLRINGSKEKNHFENGAAEIGHNKPLNTMQACMFNSLGKLHTTLESLLQA